MSIHEANWIKVQLREENLCGILGKQIYDGFKSLKPVEVIIPVCNTVGNV